MKTLPKTVAVVLLAVACARTFADDSSVYEVTNLVANSAEYNPQIVDPTMINAWGIALRPPGAGGHIWIDDARYGNSVEYIGDVAGMPLHQDGLTSVQLDTPAFTDKGYASVTGLVYNSSSDVTGQPNEFVVSGPADNDSTSPPTVIPGGTTGSAKFVFVTKDGTINAWRSNTATAMTSAPVVVDYSKTSTFPSYDPANPVYTGVAMTQNSITANQVGTAGGNHVFATDFRNNVINVFNDQWQDVTSSFHFQTPSDVGDLHPFNAMDLSGHLYVVYAEWNPASDEGFEDTPGFGHLVEYNEDGTLVKDFDSGQTSVDAGGHLNSPWGVAIAPTTFGKYGGDVLVANFGDNSIAAFDPTTGNFIDYLRDASGNQLDIDGVWGLAFGNGVSLGDANSLYFTAGPDAEQDGLFGKVTLAAPEPASLATLLLPAVLLLKRRR